MRPLRVVMSVCAALFASASSPGERCLLRINKVLTLPCQPALFSFTMKKASMQARGRHKMDYYSDSDDEAPPKAVAMGIALRASHTKPAAKAGGGKAGGKKDPAAERRARLLAEEAQAPHTPPPPSHLPPHLPFCTIYCLR